MVRLLNFSLYEIGWFACVLGAAYARTLLGVTIAISLVIVHMFLTTERMKQVRLLMFAAIVGMVVEGMLLRIGVYRFPNGPLIEAIPPIWMLVLWVQFATTFRYCLKWTSGRYALCAVLGFAGAPLAFLGGEKIGAVSFYEPRLENLLTLGVFWAVAIPLLIYVSDRIHTGVTAEASYRGLSTP